jgi:putative lipoic acid-binding regulatory protein
VATRYEQELERLSGLPRAQRFEQLMEFPTQHTFTAIGRATGLGEAMRQVLGAAGHAEVVLVERASASGTYLSLSFTVAVQTAQELDGLYLALEALPGLAYLL